MNYSEAMERARFELAMQRVLMTTAAYAAALKARIAELTGGEKQTMRQRLAAEIEAACKRAEGKPMVWGVDDCALWCAGIYRVAMGSDPALSFRGRYGDEAGAEHALGRKGLLGAIMAASTAMGWPGRIPVMDAQTGDLGLLRTPAGPACVIRSGALWIGRCDMGFAAHPNANVTHAWSVS